MTVKVKRQVERDVEIRVEMYCAYCRTQHEWSLERWFGHFIEIITHLKEEIEKLKQGEKHGLRG